MFTQIPREETKEIKFQILQLCSSVLSVKWKTVANTHKCFRHMLFNISTKTLYSISNTTTFSSYIIAPNSSWLIKKKNQERREPAA